MKMSRFTVRYLPLPQPTSRPTEPGSRPFRNLSMIGHGWKRYQRTVFAIYCRCRIVWTYFISCGRKMWSNLLVDCVDVLFFIGLACRFCRHDGTYHWKANNLVTLVVWSSVAQAPWLWVLIRRCASRSVWWPVLRLAAKWSQFTRLFNSKQIWHKQRTYVVLEILLDCLLKLQQFVNTVLSQYDHQQRWGLRWRCFKRCFINKYYHYLLL